MSAVGELDDAAAEYWATVKEHEELKSELPKTRLRMTAARERLARAIVTDARAGVGQKELTERSGYETRESIRRILRSAGIDPDKPTGGKQ